MPTTRGLIALLLALTAGLMSSSCGSEPAGTPPTAGATSATGSTPATAPVLRFSAIPDRDETELRAKFTPLAAYFADQLGIEVEYVHSADYRNSVDLFKSGDIQLAWLGGLSGAQAREAVPGARAIAQGAEDPTFVSYFIAHRDTGLERGEDFPTELEEKTFTFGSPGSTSGRLMPEYFLRQATGKSPEEFFAGTPNFSGAHDKTCELVASGQFDAGAVNYQAYDTMVADGEIDPEICRVIWKSPEYPDYNFSAHPLLEEWFGPGFIDRLQKTLLEMDDEALLKGLGRSRMISAKNEDFDSIRELALELDFLRE